MALSETESSFGEDIEPILDNALQDIKSKILGDLGVDSNDEAEADADAEAPAGSGVFIDLDNDTENNPSPY